MSEEGHNQMSQAQDDEEELTASFLARNIKFSAPKDASNALFRLSRKGKTARVVFADSTFEFANK